MLPGAVSDFLVNGEGTDNFEALGQVHKTGMSIVGRAAVQSR